LRASSGLLDGLEPLLLGLEQALQTFIARVALEQIAQVVERKLGIIRRSASRRSSACLGNSIHKAPPISTASSAISQ
jgi:hypothetical protein